MMNVVMQMPAESPDPSGGSSVFCTAEECDAPSSAAVAARGTMDELATDSVARACMMMEPSLMGVNTVEALSAVDALQSKIQGVNVLNSNLNPVRSVTEHCRDDEAVILL